MVTEDIVTRLRLECQCTDDCRAVDDPCISMRAADEIERLREQIRDCENDFHALKQMFDNVRDSRNQLYQRINDLEKEKNMWEKQARI